MAAPATGIHELPSGRFRWRVMINGTPRSGTCDTLAEARRSRLDAELVTADPRRQRTAGTVQGLLDVWLANSGHATTTAKRRDSALKAVPAEFLAAAAVDVDVPAVKALWRVMTAHGGSAETARKARNALSRAFQEAVEDGLLPSNPFRAVRVPRIDAPRIYAPSPAEVGSALEQIAQADQRHPGLSAFVRVMATIGTRPGETCALRWEGFNQKTGTIRISSSITADGEITNGKNGPKGWRTVELDPATARLVRRHQRTVGVRWIFHDQAGDPWRPDDVARWFRKATTVDWRLYDLRHFAATEALNAGVPINKIAYMLGDDPATVLRTSSRAQDAGNAAAAVARTLGAR